MKGIRICGQGGNWKSREKNIGVIYQLSQPLLFKNNFNLLVNKNLQGQCANFFPSNKKKYMQMTNNKDKIIPGK